MALTINDRLKTGALDGITEEFNVGSGTAVLELLASSTQLADLGLASTAFAPSTIVGPNAQAASHTITKDTSVTPGTIDEFTLTDRDTVALLNGSVGLSGSGADFIVTDNVVPPGATEVSSTGLTLAMALT